MATPYPPPLAYDPATREFTTAAGHAVGCLYEPDDQPGGDGLDPDTAAVEQVVTATGAKLAVAYSNYDGLLAACNALDELDCCVGYEFPQADWPKLWAALEMARSVLDQVKAEGR